MRWTGWLENWSEDERAGDLQMVDSKSFSVGHNFATTPRSVVFRNELIELIHYAPMSEEVHAVPLLFVPPWINKFYILDLNEKKSMVRYLLKQGFSVFVISWRNPDASMADTTFEDYVLKGVLAAVEAARALRRTPGARHRLLSGRHHACHADGLAQPGVRRQTRDAGQYAAACGEQFAPLADQESISANDEHG